MKSILVLMTVLFASSAFADLKSDIRDLQNLANLGSNGGGADIETYDVRKFSYQKEERELEEDIGGSSCEFTKVIGRRELIKYVDSFALYSANDRKVNAILQRLHDQKQLVGALGFMWSGDEGDSESCSLEGLKIFFKNGEVLVLAHDSTT